MTAVPLSRPPARRAGPELLVAAHWEEYLGWLLGHTGRWPKSARFTLCQRVQDTALDIAEMLVVARYEPKARRRTLRKLNLALERLRTLLRIARAAEVMPAVARAGRAAPPAARRRSASPCPGRRRVRSAAPCCCRAAA